MAGGAFARAQPGGAFGLQVSNGVLHCLLDLVEQEFEPLTLQAFRRLALEGKNGAETAQELNLSVASVYTAKSRVLARIRQEAEGLIDDG